MTNSDMFKDVFPQSRQVGGSHYKMRSQPYKFIRLNNFNFFQGVVIKYISRLYKKSKSKTIEDLQKIIHYCEMEIKLLKEKKRRYKIPDDSPEKEEEWAAMIAQMQDT